MRTNKYKRNRRDIHSACSIICILILSFFLLMTHFSTQGFAADKILFQNGSSRFTQKNADNLLELAEFIGGSQFSAKDKKLLQIWSVDDFKHAPEASMDFYQALSQATLPKVKKSKGNNVYRAELYLNIVDSFAKHPEYKKVPDNLLSIIDRYNPPIKEALLIRQIRFNMVMQQSKTNQKVFNTTMQNMQRSRDAISQSIEDQAKRQSITIPGGKILRETDEKIFAEDQKGQKFEVVK